MQHLTIQAATRLSAQDLYSALSEFKTNLVTDEEGRYLVSVELGSDRNLVEVLATIQEFVDSGADGVVANSMVFSLNDRAYTIHPE